MSSSFASAAGRVVDATKRVFGTSVTYTPDGGSPVTITAVRGPRQELEESSSDRYEHWFVKLADLAATPATNDELTVAAVAHRVVDVELDGEGGAMLTVQKKT